jgi:hypothetical protein
MGFTPDETHYKLVFADPKLAGLEVTAAELMTGELMDLMVMAEAADPKNPSAGSAEAAAGMIGYLGSSLVSWNVMKAGQPVDADLAGVRAQPFSLTFAIVIAWIGAMTDVPGPLDGGSPSGGPAQAESALNLGNSSQNLPS